MHSSLHEPASHIHPQLFSRDAFGQPSSHNIHGIAQMPLSSSDLSFAATAIANPLQHFPPHLYQQFFIPPSFSPSAPDHSAAPTLASVPSSLLPLASNEVLAGHAHSYSPHQLSAFPFPDMSHSMVHPSWTYQHQQQMTIRPSKPLTQQHQQANPSSFSSEQYSALHRHDNHFPSSLPSPFKSEGELAAFSQQQQINLNDSPPPAIVSIGSPSSSPSQPRRRTAPQTSSNIHGSPINARNVCHASLSTSTSSSRKRQRLSYDEEEDPDAEGEDDEDAAVVPLSSSASANRKETRQSAAARRGKQPQQRQRQRRDSVDRGGSGGSEEGREGSEEPGRENYWGVGKVAYQALSAVEKKQLRNKLGARKFRSRRKEYITELEQKIDQRDERLARIRSECMANAQLIAELRASLAQAKSGNS